MNKKVSKVLSFFKEYFSFIYENMVKDNDLYIYKDNFKFIFKFLNFVRSIFIYIISILLFPVFYIGMEIEKEIKK
jgi:hypothetical protein